MTVITELADFSHHLELDSVPEDAIGAAQGVFTDFLGNCFGGSLVDEVRRIRQVTVARGGRPQATVVSSGQKVPVPAAAYVNGAVADAFEYQDGYRYGGYHPSHVLPAVLACAEDQDVTGEDLLAAVVVAYEVANRVSRDLHPAATLRGWFPVGASFGAAAGVARLLGLDDQGIAHALGCVPLFVPAVLIDCLFAGPSIKPAFAGQLARAGVEAAEHARSGLTGWTEAMEAPRGVLRVFAGEGPRRITHGLGDEWTILDVHQKAFAGCRHTHGAAQACIDFAASGLRPVEVENVEVRVYRIAKELVDRPSSVASATSQCVLSLPYTVAVALFDREVGPQQFTSERIADPAVHALAARVRVEHDDALDARYPDETVTQVHVRLTDGTTRYAEVARPLGDPRNPLTTEAFEAKLEGNLALMAAAERTLLRSQLRSLRKLPSVRGLMEVFAGTFKVSDPAVGPHRESS